MKKTQAVLGKVTAVPSQSKTLMMTLRFCALEQKLFTFMVTTQLLENLL